ncbi:Chaperone protein DnaJ [compost metagenome]
MKTLYEVLGVSKQATLSDIEAAYRASLETLAVEAPTLSADEREIREKVIREARSILSSPGRRAAYDEKMRNKARAMDPVVESSPVPWLKIAAALLLIIGCFYIYQVRADKAEAELAALEAKKAQAEAERAEQLALAEQARLEQQKLQERRAQQHRQDQEIARARYEGHQIHENLQRIDAQVARDKLYAERQAQMDKQREDQAIKARTRSEISAMERALNIPIRRH